MIVWNYGGGINSVAMGVLIKEGALPKPEISVIADTGREIRSTWDYLHGVMQPYLDPTGVKIEIASHDLARVDLFDNSGLTIMPAYTTEGRLQSFCSGEWKRDVVMRWLRARGVTKCEQWIGFSIDEFERASKVRRKWCSTTYPLIDRFINRAMCISLIKAAGLEVPRKSRCKMCPHQSNEEWLEVRSMPDEWSEAVQLDSQIRQHDPQGTGLFVHASRQPLPMVDFDGSSPLVAPLRPCDAGNCWT